jgi:hypothetical protein
MAEDLEGMSSLPPIDEGVLEKFKTFSGTPEEVDALGPTTMQRVQTSYITAIGVQKPRSMTRAVHNILGEADLAGANFYYRWMVYDKKKKRDVPIEGGSIDAMMCIARNYGNCAVESQSDETNTHYVIQASFVDLETGFTCRREFRQRKSQSLSAKMDTDRQEDLVFQIGQSKAMRNVIKAAMPGWLVDQVVARAKAAELKGIRENTAMVRVTVIDWYAQRGVDQERLERKTGQTADKWTPQDILALREAATAINEGRVMVDELFPPVPVPDVAVIPNPIDPQQLQEPPPGPPAEEEAATKSAKKK